MAISTYSELQAAAANWLVRADLTTRIPEFIALAEARLNRVMRGRLAETESSLTATPSSRTIALPAAYGEALRLWIVIDGDRAEVEYAGPVLTDASAMAGQPQFWGVDGSAIAFERPCDQAYSFILRHLARFALSDAVPTNWLLTDHPDIYLFATLAEAGPFLRDAELAGAYETKLGRAIAEANFKEGRAHGMQPLRTEIAEMVGGVGGFDIRRGY